MEKSDKPGMPDKPEIAASPAAHPEEASRTENAAEASGQAYRDQPLPLFQTDYWACVKQHTGWKHFYLPAESSADSIADSTADSRDTGGKKAVLCLEKKFLPGFSMVYIPGLISAQTAHTEAEMQHLAAAAKRRAGAGCCFVRIDSFEPVSAETNFISAMPFVHTSDFGLHAVLKGARMKRAVQKGTPIRSDVEIQPTATVIVDCRQPLEYIRNRYRTRVQRVLRKGKRDGAAGVENDGRNGEESGGSEIVCRKFSADELDSQLLSRWYALYAATADRGHFSVRSKTYIENIFACSRRIDTAVSRYSEDCCSSETRKSAVQASFFGAFAGNVLAAGVIIAETEEAAWYLYGASSGKYLKQGAMYRLQDAVIADVSSRVSWYDMYGIAPENMPRHPLSDLNLFKKGFGGFTVQRTGIIDVPYHPLLYSLFRIRERRRSRRRQSPRQHISSGLFLFSR